MKEERTQKSEIKPESESSSNEFPIIGIGASAGKRRQSMPTNLIADSTRREIPSNLNNGYPTIRETIRMLIEETKNLTLIGEAATAEEALEVIQNAPESSPPADLILVGVSLPQMNGIELTARIGNRIRTLVLTGHDQETYRERALAAGAEGFVLKTNMFQELISAIEVALHSEDLTEQTSE